MFFYLQKANKPRLPRPVGSPTPWEVPFLSSRGLPVLSGCDTAILYSLSATLSVELVHVRSKHLTPPPIIARL